MIDVKALQKAVQQSLLPEEKVWEDNAIARAIWSTSSPFTEQIVVRLVHRLQQTGKIEDNELSIREIVGAHAHGHEYDEARNLSKAIRSDSVHLPLKNGDFVDYNLFRGRFYYSAKKQTFKISLNPDILQFYVALGNNFTVFGITEFLELKGGVYAQRLYHNLMSWIPHKASDKGYWDVSVDELGRLLGVPENTPYEELKRIINRTLKKINTKTSLDVSWDVLEKDGRRVKKLRFLHHTYQPFNKAPKAINADTGGAKH